MNPVCIGRWELAMSEENIIEVKDLSKAFGNHEVLRKIDFSVKKGDVISILGSSGSGKSTLLRCVNRLEHQSSGHILYHGKEIRDVQKDVNEYRSKVGMVFQSFNLFNNMTVLENCMAGTRKVLHLSKEEAKERAIEHLKKVGMAPYINVLPEHIESPTFFTVIVMFLYVTVLLIFVFSADSL